MFTCGICKEVSKPREKATRLIVETREKLYPSRKSVNHFVDRNGVAQTRDDPGGIGREIVKEVLAHEKCGILYRNRVEETKHV